MNGWLIAQLCLAQCLVVFAVGVDKIEEDRMHEDYAQNQAIIRSSNGEGMTYAWAVSLHAKQYRGFTSIFGLNRQTFCDGVLIGPRLIATSASCLYIRDNTGQTMNFTNPEMWRVRFATEIPKTSVRERIRDWFRRGYNSIFSKKMHANYKVGSIAYSPHVQKESFTPNIALFQLREELNTHQLDILHPVEIPNEMESKGIWPYTNQRCMAVTWGCDWEGKPALPVRSREMKILELNKCSHASKYPLDMKEDQAFCAEIRNDHGQICPNARNFILVCPSHDGIYKLAGIPAGEDPNRPMYDPMLFNRVAYFGDWIRDKMNEE